MFLIKDKNFAGERPLYNQEDLELINVHIGRGESALKEGKNFDIKSSRFDGKYPLWCCSNVKISDSIFTVGARAAIWYSKNLSMEDCMVCAPKMFREDDGIVLNRVELPSAAETFWHCKNIKAENLRAERADYIFMKCENIYLENFNLQGNYSFQWSSNIEIHNSFLDTKDAFWEAENVTIYDSTVRGEFLAWHSRNVKFVRCRLGGSQALCYANNLVLEDCIIEEDVDLAFEYSSVNATIKGHIPSVKNPKSGSITADSIGEIILDENAKQPANCEIILRKGN